MEAWEYWTLLDRLTIVQAALMAANLNPSDWKINPETVTPDDVPSVYFPIVQFIVDAVITGYVYAETIDRFDEHGCCLGLNLLETKIARETMIMLLEEKGINSRYFRPLSNNIDPLNTNSEFYSSKLAAANEAWKTVITEKHRLNKCTPKQALETWLEENAARFGLLNSDGSFNRSGIEEVAKVANWKTKGGAPQLTAIYEEPEKEPSKANSQQTLNPFDDLDSEFPF